MLEAPRWVKVVEEEQSEAEAPPAVGDRVRHAEWGEGMVARLAGDAVTVLFDEVGFKTLALAIVWPEKLRLVAGGNGNHKG